MMKIMNLQLTVVFAILIPFSITGTVFYHQEFFKYHNATVNPRNATIIQFMPYLVGYPLKPLRIVMTTNQYARTTMSAIIKNNYRSPCSKMNVHLHEKPVETDTGYSDTPAIDDVSSCAQLFVGTK